MYKNWKKICNAPDPNFVLMMALLDVETTFGSFIADRLPEFFTAEKQSGPYPFSMLREEARKGAARDACSCNGIHVVSHNAVPEDVPTFGFDIHGQNLTGLGEPFPLLPKDINKNAIEGDLVIWDGQQFVVLENNQSCEEMWLAPAELIDVTC